MLGSCTLLLSSEKWFLSVGGSFSARASSVAIWALVIVWVGQYEDLFGWLQPVVMPAAARALMLGSCTLLLSSEK